jgi:hypothetical protein
VPGDTDLLVAARTALLDALEALADQRDALVLIGAQALYLHTGAAVVALAEATKDSDLAVDPRALRDEPLLDEAMTQAGFHRDLVHPQPGGWLSPDGIPVDLMVPAALAGTGSGRGARIPPHDRHAARRTVGLEAAMVDHAPMRIGALDPADTRTVTIPVAGPAALLVSKLHKLGERQGDAKRLVDKDAHDVYRLLVATETADLASSSLRSETTSWPASPRAQRWLTCASCSAARATGSGLRWRAGLRSWSVTPSSSRRRSPPSPTTFWTRWVRLSAERAARTSSPIRRSPASA